MSTFSVSFVIILFYRINSLSLNCNPISMRDGVNIYEWNDIEYGVCKLPTIIPFIIINSPLKKWGKSTMKHIIKTLKESNTKIGVEYRRSNCAKCGFDVSNISKCHEFVNTFSTPSYGKEKLTGNRIDYFWYKYELNDGNVLGLFPHKQFENEQCINQRGIARKTIRISKAIKKAKSLSLSRDKKSLDNYTNYTYSAVKFATVWKLDDYEKHNYANLIKYENMKPFFQIFGMKEEYNDIHMISAWTGTNGYITNFHYDQANNMYFMIKGNKTFQMTHNVLFNDNFVIFPFLNFYFLNFAKYEEKYLDYPRINVYTNEILYIPSYWFHRVINDKYNTYALNVWIRDYQIHKIQNYQFSKNLGQILFANIMDNWQQTLYLLQQIHFRIFGENSLFQYFSKMYPVLYDIQKYHMMIGNSNSMNNDNLNWLSWFIDLDNMLKCGQEGIINREFLRIILINRENTLFCPLPYEYDKEVANTINEVSEILLDIQSNYSQGTAQLELAEFSEKILYLITEDTMYLPLLVSLHQL